MVVKEFKRIVAPRVQIKDPGLQDKVNRALEDLARGFNDAMDSLVRNTIRGLPFWTTGELHTINLKAFKQAGRPISISDDIVIRHHLGVKPSGFIVYDAHSTAATVSNNPWSLLRSPSTTWTTTQVFFRANNGAYANDMVFEIVLLP
jgi:hypothetical protein